MRPKNNLYKGKYIIGIYEKDDDILVAVVENVEEFANFFNITKTAANQLLYRLYNKQANYLKHFENIYFVHFITEED